MKTMKFQKMMVLVLAAAVWAGCTQENPVVTEEQVTEEQHTTVQFTATLEGKGGEATKALNSDGTATWAVDEEIALYYQTTSSYATATATVTSVDASGNATISATLTDAKDAGTVKFVYPATLHDGSGGIYSTIIQLCQTGNLTGTNSISEYYDAATGDGTLTVSGGSASLSSSVSMTNPLCICKFQFYLTADASGASTSTIDAYTIKYIVIDAVSNETGSKRYYVHSDRTSGDSVRNFNQEEDIYLAMYPANGEEFTFTAVVKSGFNTKVFTKTISNVTLEENKFYNKISSLALALNNSASEPTVSNVYSGDISTTISVAAGETIVLSGATCSVSSGPAIECEGDATIILAGSNSASTSADNYPAIQAGGEGTTLNIQGPGSLTATGGYGAAGIGPGSNGTCGAITISGGAVTATGGAQGAGIGSGYDGICGNITISGGEVTATGGGGGAGIGSGLAGSCGTITISGGEVTATGGLYGAGIGSGNMGKFSSISITSGITSVKATMGSGAQAPIGRGKDDRSSGTVTIDNTLTKEENGNTWTLT